MSDAYDVSAAHAQVAADHLAHRDGVLDVSGEGVNAPGLVEHVLDGAGGHAVVDDEEEAHLGEGVAQLGGERSLSSGIGHRLVEGCEIQHRNDV